MTGQPTAPKAPPFSLQFLKGAYESSIHALPPVPKTRYHDDHERKAMGQGQRKLLKAPSASSQYPNARHVSSTSPFPSFFWNHDYDKRERANLNTNGSKVIRAVPPILRLPIELRLEIALMLQEPQPIVKEAAKSCCLEHYLLEYNRKRKAARAILRVAGFNGLKKIYPFAFEGRDLTMYTYQRMQRRCNEYGLEENQPTGHIFQPFGLHPLHRRFLRASDADLALEMRHPENIRPESRTNLRHLMNRGALSALTSIHMVVEANKTTLQGSLYWLFTYRSSQLRTIKVSILINQRATNLGRSLDLRLVDPNASFSKVDRGCRWFTKFVECFSLDTLSVSGVEEVVLEVWKQEAMSITRWSRDKNEGKWMHGWPTHHGRYVDPSPPWTTRLRNYLHQLHPDVPILWIIALFMSIILYETWLSWSRSAQWTQARSCLFYQQ